MAMTDKELEQQLLEAGNKLMDPPPSVDDLLPLLNQVENCLSKVEQSPTPSMQSALATSQNALVADQLFKHSDTDVKVAVASCISEITRITAPDAPYDDDQMKDVFQLIVSSFENLADKSSRSYGKRTSILETVAKVRSCVVMLDLECEALIVEMFQHFLDSIRDYHPENVFSSMETIMTLVLEESEEISHELLFPLLASTKRDNEKVLPVARKLGDKVLESCAAKVKPYLQNAVRSLNITLDDYSDIVGSICQETSGTDEQTDLAADENKAEESKPAGASSNHAAQADIEIAAVADADADADVGSPKQADTKNEKSPKSVVSNGVAQVVEDDSLADSCSIKQQDDGNHANQPKSGDASSNAEPDISDVEKVVDEESKREQASKKREKEDDSAAKLTKPSESSHIDGGNEAKHILDVETPSKDVPSSPHVEPSIDTAASSDNKKEADGGRPFSPKAQEGESKPVSSPSQSGNLPDRSLPKKGGRSKRKGSKIKEIKSSTGDVPKKESEVPTDSETKPYKKSAGKASGKNSNEEKVSIETDALKNESDATNESKEKSLKQLSKKAVSSRKKGGGSSPIETDVLKHDSDATNESEEKPLKLSSKKAEPSRKKGGGSSPIETDALKNDSDATEDSDEKPLKQSSKRVDSSKKKGGGSSPIETDSLKNDSDATDDSDEKPLKLSSRKADASRKNGGGSSSKVSESKKQRSRGKSMSGKNIVKSTTKVDDKISSPKSAAKSAQDAHQLEETPKTNIKRKHTSGSEKASEVKDDDDDTKLVGSRVKVWWPKDRTFYKGYIGNYDPAKKRHEVCYDDGEKERLNLKKEKWELIKNDSTSDEEEKKVEEADPQSPEIHSDRPLKKKAKTNTDQSSKQVKLDASPLRGGGGSSSKSRSAATKSGKKSKEATNTDSKSVDGSKAIKTANDDDGAGKNKGGTKSANLSSKASSKSKTDDVSTSKPGKSKEDGPKTPTTASKLKQEAVKTGKSKQDTPKTPIAKGKSPKSVNGTGKLKSDSSKVKETEEDDNSTDSEELQETRKGGKSSDSAKRSRSVTKSGKKRQRV